MNSSLIPLKYLCYLPLTRFAPKCPKKAPVFSTTYEPPSPITTCVIYHLGKKGRGRAIRTSGPACRLPAACLPVRQGQAGKAWLLPGAVLTDAAREGSRTRSRRAPSAPLLTPLFPTLSAKPYTNPPLSKPFEFNQFQTSRKTAPAKSFRMTFLQKVPLFLSAAPSEWVTFEACCGGKGVAPARRCTENGSWRQRSPCVERLWCCACCWLCLCCAGSCCGTTRRAGGIKRQPPRLLKSRRRL